MSRCGEDNAAVAFDLIQAAQERQQQREHRRAAGFPELEIERQIAELKRRNLETGLDVKERLLELRRRHHDMTGASGG